MNHISMIVFSAVLFVVELCLPTYIYLCRQTVRTQRIVPRLNWLVFPAHLHGFPES